MLVENDNMYGKLSFDTVLSCCVFNGEVNTMNMCTPF